jgi:putative ABC transport system permease protein
LLSIFGGTSLGSSFAPTIYLSKKALLSTGLIQPGSIVNHAHYYKFPQKFDIDKWKEENKLKLRGEGVRSETIEDRKENLKEAFFNLNYFLNLVAMVSLLLGSIGVASSVFIYIKSKASSIAVMRCLGLKTRSAFAIYFVQIVFLGLLAVIIGTIVGSSIQMALPMLLKDFLPVQVSMVLSWKSIVNGLLIGSVITLLFSLLPLLEIRYISPLKTLRTNEGENEKVKDQYRPILYVLIVASLFFFMYRITSSWKDGLGFTIGLLMTFVILYFISIAIIKLLRKFTPSSLSFEIRQGISNLYRPNNQTTTLVLSLGLGTSVLTLLYLIQGLLLQNVSMMDSGNQPNTLLYGIESDQVKSIIDTTKSFHLPVMQSVPIVTMKLDSWKGKTKNEWLKDTINSRENMWAMNREARVTYRDTLDKDEKLLKGKINLPVRSANDSVFVSLADSYAEALKVDIGDEMIFNVQGTTITAYVGSIREISFRNMSTRFFIVFPTGVLEQAPQFSVLVTKIPDAMTIARYRNAIVKAFPNVSIVELGSILKTVNEILNKVSYVIKFMAIFSLITGLIVLISSLMLSKFQRIGESILLRTLGAKKASILKINIVEYLVLGLLASLSGVLMSVVSAFIIAKFQLEMDFDLNWWPIFLIVIFITGTTLLIGMFNSREVVNKPPLEVLRNEG